MRRICVSQLLETYYTCNIYFAFNRIDGYMCKKTREDIDYVRKLEKLLTFPLYKKKQNKQIVGSNLVARAAC